MALPELKARVSCVFTREPTPEDLGQTPKPGGKAPATFARTQVPSSQEVEVGPQGLCGSVAFNNSKKFIARGYPPKDALDRAVLVQTAANLEAMRSAGLQLNEELSVKPGSFGENLFLEGGNFGASTVCIGDEFCLFRNEKQLALRVQVVSPRLPCGKVDSKNGKTFSAHGVRAHCAQTGQAGIFLKVLVPGTIQEGDTIKLAARPNPSWDLARVSRLLYGHPTAVMQYLPRSAKANKDACTPIVLREEWMGTEAELKELVGMPALGSFEWKECMVRMLELPGIGRYTKKSFQCSPRTFALIGSTVAIAAAVVGMALVRRGKSTS
eukprot:gnl/MRDRNA2_/MRDRNA2_18587_c0_seq1.p1 gnl/MRDRNA2_/MRDRNA2_18587_c0~~gnl/MRDRNA2_/MRDRNA2_18587_c0_seq1.p1  ORF type:complete len:355 (-),score=71.80 gnl/MRDRNA2_/MRDRNA2_18587_c0_seq1:2-976(-)